MQSDIKIGVRVEVSLKNKLYSAIVAEIHEDLALEYKAKPIVAMLDKVPLVTEHQLTLWRWMSDYYCCTVGEVMNVAMPSGLKLESETRVVYNGDFDEQVHELSDDEYLVAEAVSIQNELTILQIQEILNKKTIFPVLRSLLDKKVISIKEELIEKFKPKMASFMTLNEPYKSDINRLTEAFDLVTKSEKQTKVLLAFVQLSRNKHFTLPVSDICQLSGTDNSAVQALVKKEIFTVSKQRLSRIFNNGSSNDETEALQSLSDQQIIALDEIRVCLE